MKRRREPENEADNTNIIDSKIGNTLLPSGQVATGPTSFAGLIPSSADVQNAKPARRIKTFQDVATAGAQANLGAAGPFIPLSQSDWLPPIMAPRLPAVKADQSSNPEAATASAALDFSASWEDLQEPPMDWSLKQALRFTSTQPFSVLDECRKLPRSKIIDIERNLGVSIDIDDEFSAASKLLQATMTWQFPQNPQPPAASRPIDNSIPASLQQRRRDWQEAFCSLYDALRNSQCAGFYVVSPQLPSGIGKQPTSVFFGAEKTGGRERIHAVMGRSTTGIRDVLRMQGIAFDAPLLSSSGAGPSNDGTRSMLIFEGILRVHALFDFLLNRGFTLADDLCDVPVLMAPMQFAHASVTTFQLKSKSAATTTATATGKSRKKSTAPSMIYALELKGCGYIPAWVSDRLLCVLSETQQPAGVTMHCDPLPASIALNWHAVQAPKRKHKGWVVDGCLDAEEYQRWTRTTPGLDTAAIREIKFSEGVYTVVQATARVLPALR